MNRTSFAVNPDTCIRCGLCVSDCVCAIIEMDDLPCIASDNLEKCIHCGHCQAICPTGSVTLDGIDPKRLTDAGKPVPEDVIADIVRNRRSVRQFHQEPVAADALEKAVAIAAWAPTAINIRDIGFVVVNGRDKVESLMAACADVMEKYGLFPEVAANIRKGRDVLFRGAPCVLAIYASERPYAVSDCATTLAAMELSLPSIGLASCWAGLFTTTCGKELPAGLKIPEGRKVFGGLMIGRPKIHYKKVPWRPVPPVAWL